MLVGWIAVNSDLLQLRQAAEILGVPIETIRRWAKKGLIKPTLNHLNDRVFNMDELRRMQSNYQWGDSEAPELKVLKHSETNYNVIELFSGCGGMALGFENAGLQTKLLVEIEKNAVATLRKNRPQWNVVSDDIKNVNFGEYYGSVEIVAGGFPCQAFSYAGKGLGFGEPRGTLFFEFLRAVNEVRPKIAVGENVRGLLQHDGGRTLATMLHCLKESGYRPMFHLVRAQFLDVPQKRERLIIVAIRDDFDAIHLFPKEHDYTVTLRQAFQNVPLSVGYTYSARKYEIMKQIPPGGYWRDLPDDLQREFMGASYFQAGGRTGMARRLSMDEPSLTLTCNPAQKQTERCHPIETRPLNVREYARLQTFPDDWEFCGAVSSQYKQIGNAVPVNLGYHVGRSLISMLDGKKNPNDFYVKSEGKQIEGKPWDKNQLELVLGGN